MSIRPQRHDETCTEAPIRRPPIGPRPSHHHVRAHSDRGRRSFVRRPAGDSRMLHLSLFPCPLSVFALQIWDVTSALCQRIPSLGSTGHGPPSYQSTAAHLPVRWRRSWGGRRRGRRGPPAGCWGLGVRVRRKKLETLRWGAATTSPRRSGVPSKHTHATRAGPVDRHMVVSSMRGGVRARMWRRGRMMTAVVVASRSSLSPL